MSEPASIISDELRAAIGVESAPREVEIERSEIRKYADAMQDPNPIYFDAAFANAYAIRLDHRAADLCLSSSA